MSSDPDFIHSSRAPEPVGAYPHARRVGNLLFLSGVGPRERGTKKIPGVELDAMGNVLVTTSLLPAIKRKYLASTVEWITLGNAAPLLANNPLLDRVHVWEPESWLVLQQRRFDLVMNVDKSRRSGAFTMSLNARKKLGFGINRDGAIVPLNPQAGRGLDDRRGVGDLRRR